MARWEETQLLCRGYLEHQVLKRFQVESSNRKGWAADAYYQSVLCCIADNCCHLFCLFISSPCMSVPKLVVRPTVKIRHAFEYLRSRTSEPIEKTRSGPKCRRLLPCPTNFLLSLIYRLNGYLCVRLTRMSRSFIIPLKNRQPLCLPPIKICIAGQEGRQVLPEAGRPEQGHQCYGEAQGTRAITNRLDTPQMAFNLRDLSCRFVCSALSGGRILHIMYIHAIWSLSAKPAPTPHKISVPFAVSNNVRTLHTNHG